MTDFDLNTATAELSNNELAGAMRDLNVFETTTQVQGKFQSLVEELLSARKPTREAGQLSVRDALKEAAVFRWGSHDAKTLELDLTVRALSDEDLAGAMRDLAAFERSNQVQGKFQALAEEFRLATNEVRETVLISVRDALEKAAVFRWGAYDARTQGKPVPDSAKA